jgi:AraC-like DNA-binding protein
MPGCQTLSADKKARLCLLEARRLMVSCGVNVDTACFQVGYESPSQFTREYAPMFGAPPKRDTHQMRVVLHKDREGGSGGVNGPSATAGIRSR